MTKPDIAVEPLPADFIKRLGATVGEDNLLTERSDCWAYGYDNSRRHACPQAVVFGRDHQQISALLRLCNEYKVPIVARGRGTGTTGATVPDHGGLVLSLERMNRILEIDADNRLARVEPGVTNQELQDAIGEHGFFWPPDHTSAAYCSIGGNLAYNSAGPRAVKYGTPRENTFGLRAITGLGEEIRTGVMTSKGVVGYDLTRLLIGSEGTLAVITEATLKLTPLPEATRTIQACYKDIHSAAAAVSAIMAQATIPRILEFMDNKALEMVRNFSDPGLPDGTSALLMVSVDGPAHGLEAAAGEIRKAAENPGLILFETAETEEALQRLWKTRKSLSPALRNVAPKKINEDVVVPISRIPDLIDGLERLSEQHGIIIVNFGHAGNGNIHVNLLLDPDRPGMMEKAEACLDDVFDLVLKLGGTLSGEHGVGLEKRDFIDREIDPVTLRLMRDIKRQFDPNDILNPGKMFPAA